MSKVDANLVKKLREKTGSGFLDCKKALEKTNNDFEAAMAFLRENGLAKVAKKADRIAAEGVIIAKNNDHLGIILELNCETDFVAKNQEFIALAHDIANLQLNLNSDQISAEIKEKINLLSAKIGEKISLRRLEKITKKDGQTIASYTHTNFQMGALVLCQGQDQNSARDVAMHVAALNPTYNLKTEVPVAEMAKIESELKNSSVLQNKPENIKNKILEGMLSKKLSEFVLEEQPFVKEDSLTVAKFLATKNMKLINAKRFEVGEGIEKKITDFASEVAKQITN